MSTRYQANPRLGWLLLLGGLTACGYDMPWGAPQAATEGSLGREPGTDEEMPGTGTPTPVEAMGSIDDRFVTQGIGPAWQIRSYDLDGDGSNELIYAGAGIAAVTADGKPLWTLRLPAVGAELKEPGKGGQGYGGKQGSPRDGYQEPTRGGDQEYDDQGYDDQGYDDQGYDDQGYDDQGYEEGKETNEGRFFGVHARDVRLSGSNLLVLDSENRVHLVDGQDGAITWSMQLDGTACELALLNADTDDTPDFFPSGGNAAYSGKTGERIWEANVGFMPTFVKVGDVDGDRMREILLVEGEPMSGDICPIEKDVLAAKHESLGTDTTEEESNAPAPSRGKKGSPNVVLLDRYGDTMFQTSVPGDVTAVSFADLAGDRKQDIVLGTDQGLVALDAKGNTAFSADVQGKITHILPLDLDGDRRQEIVVSAHDTGSVEAGPPKDTLLAYGMNGRELWSDTLEGHAFGFAAYDLDTERGKELVVSYGYGEGKATAPTIAYSIDDKGANELYRVETAAPVHAFTLVQEPEGNRLYLGSGDGTLNRLGRDGKLEEVYQAGSMNHAIGSGDIDGDGQAEVVTGDVFGNLKVSDADGNELATGTFDIDSPAVVTGIDIAEPKGTNTKGYVVASGYAWRSDKAGVLQVWDAEGNTVFSKTFDEGLAKAQIADLNGDGTDEIVVTQFAFEFGAGMEQKGQDEGGTRPSPSRRGQGGRDSRQGGDTDEARDQAPEKMGTCGVLAYDLEGKELWNAMIGDCDFSTIAVGDIDGDGADEVAYGTLGKSGPYDIALLGGDGQPLWQATNDTDDAVWIEVIRGGVAYGGRSEQGGGHVTLLDTRGNESWRADIETNANLDIPGMEDSPFGRFAGSLFGAKTPDMDGDNVEDLAFTTVGGDVMVVSGKSGDALWEAPLLDTAMGFLDEQGYGEGRGQQGYGEDRGQQGRGQQGRDEQGRDQQGRGRQGYGAQGANVMGGPIAFVPAESGNGGALVVTGYDFATGCSGALAFDMRGNATGLVPFDGFVAGIAPTEWSNNEPGIAIATTFDTYGLDVSIEPMQGRGQRLPNQPVDEDEEPID